MKQACSNDYRGGPDVAATADTQERVPTRAPLGVPSSSLREAEASSHWHASSRLLSTFCSACAAWSQRRKAAQKTFQSRSRTDPVARLQSTPIKCAASSSMGADGHQCAATLLLMSTTASAPARGRSPCRPAGPPAAGRRAPPAGACAAAVAGAAAILHQEKRVWSEYSCQPDFEGACEHAELSIPAPKWKHLPGSQGAASQGNSAAY